MRIEQLRDLVTIVEQGSLRAAARALGVQQPALTKSIRALERELGVTLFERDPRGMVLTAYGQRVHVRACAIVSEMRRVRDDIDQLAGEAQGTVAVGLSIMPHFGLLPHALPAFKHRYPKVRLKIVEGMFPDLEARLRQGSIDFYIGAEARQPPAPGLVSKVWFENTRAVVGRQGHPLAQARSLAELTMAEWCTASLDYNAEEDLVDTFTSQGLPTPPVMLQAGSAMSLIISLAHTDMLAFVPQQWAELTLTRGLLQVIPIQERIAAPSVVLIRKPELPLTPAAEYFCDLMQRHVPASGRLPGTMPLPPRRARG